MTASAVFTDPLPVLDVYRSLGMNDIAVFILFVRKLLPK